MVFLICLCCIQAMPDLEASDSRWSLGLWTHQFNLLLHGMQAGSGEAISKLLSACAFSEEKRLKSEVSGVSELAASIITVVQWFYSCRASAEVFDQKGRWLANSAREDFKIEPAPTSTLPSVASMHVQNNMHQPSFSISMIVGWWIRCETRWSQTSKQDDQDASLCLLVNALRWVGEWRVWQGHIVAAAFARCCSSSIPPGLSLCICQCCSFCCMVFSVC